MTGRRQTLTTALLLLALGAGLAVWIVLPWQGVLAAAVLLALWLAFSRSGRLTLAATRLGVGSLPQRWGASSVVVVGIAGVVGVLVAMLAMAEGFRATLVQAGSEETVIVLRGGSQTEVNSVIGRDLGPLIAGLPGVARDDAGAPIASAELSQVVTLPSRSSGEDANAQFRGVGPGAWAVRPQVRIIEGRNFGPGLRELIAGEGARREFRGLEVGNTLRLGNEEWTVVGIFASGDVHDSELWTDFEVLSSAYRRGAYQSVTARVEPGDGLARFGSALEDDPRLQLDMLTTRDYFARQSERLSTLIRLLGTVIGAIMAIGAVFGALNTMYAAISVRAREIATMRAIGFRGLPVVVAVMLETMLLALAGGLLGAGVAWLVFNGYSVSTLGANFSQVAFQFQVTPALLWTGLKWALGIGLAGGLLPAMRAAQLPVTTALRSA